MSFSTASNDVKAKAAIRNKSCFPLIFLSVSFTLLLLCAMDRIFTKLDRRDVSDQTPSKHFFVNLGISMSYNFWEGALYLHLTT